MTLVQVRCPVCGSTVPADTDKESCFCMRCGSRLDPSSMLRPRFCTQCGRELPRDSRDVDFCIYCGSKVSPVERAPYTGFSGGYAVVSFNLPSPAGSKAFSSCGFKVDGKDMDQPLKGSSTYTVRTTSGMHQVEYRTVSGSLIPKVKRTMVQLDMQDGAVYDIVEREDGFDYIRR